MELEALLPNAEHLSIDSLRIESSVIHIRMRSTEASATCPVCQSASSCVHSRYARMLKDLPWRGKAVQTNARDENRGDRHEGERIAPEPKVEIDHRALVLAVEALDAA